MEGQAGGLWENMSIIYTPCPLNIVEPQSSIHIVYVLGHARSTRPFHVTFW